MSKAHLVSKPAPGGERVSTAATLGTARKRAYAGRPTPEIAASKQSPIVGPSKSDQILKLLRRKKGVSLGDLQKATGWQAHSVRGFLSGTVKKRLGLPVQSERTGKGDRRYLIVES